MFIRYYNNNIFASLNGRKVKNMKHTLHVGAGLLIFGSQIDDQYISNTRCLIDVKNLQHHKSPNSIFAFSKIGSCKPTSPERFGRQDEAASFFPYSARYLSKSP
jgi:hypothetical protein